jgi:hypothetical protein
VGRIRKEKKRDCMKDRDCMRDRDDTKIEIV